MATGVATDALEGLLAVPVRVRGIVVLADARDADHALFRAGFATLEVDPLTAGCEGDSVVAAIDWLGRQAIVGDIPEFLRELPVGCLATTPVGAEAVRAAAAARPDRVASVVVEADTARAAGAFLRAMGAA